MNGPGQEVAEEIRARLESAADPTRAPAMQAYMKSGMPFRGVGAPALKALCRDVLDARRLDEAGWRSAVADLWDRARFREERYAAIAVARHRFYRPFQRPELLGLYRHLVVTGAWWDLVDPVATHLVGDLARSHPEEVIPVLGEWAVDDDLWLRRTAILSQVRSKGGTDLALLTHALESNLVDSPHGKDFFIRKAVGWALREHARTDPEWVRRFVAEHEERLAPLSRREALRHLV